VVRYQWLWQVAAGRLPDYVDFYGKLPVDVSDRLLHDGKDVRVRGEGGRKERPKASAKGIKIRS